MSLPVPQNSDLAAVKAANQALCDAFEAHPSMQSQYAAKAGNVYFMWDFAKRTNAMLEPVVGCPWPDGI